MEPRCSMGFYGEGRNVGGFPDLPWRLAKVVKTAQL
jgi:hypothetical protein